MAAHPADDRITEARIGGVGEWLIPPDCKSGARKGYVGSNPTPSTNRLKVLELVNDE